MNGVGLLACFPRVNPNKLRSAASLRCLGTQTARQCFRFPPPQRPCQVSRASPFGRDASATPVRQTQRFVSLRYLALHYGGFTGSNIKASSPAQPPPFRSRRSAPRPAETGTGGRATQLAEKFADNPGLLRWSDCQDHAPCFAPDSALRASRGSNLHCVPVRADRARIASRGSAQNAP